MSGEGILKDVNKMSDSERAIEIQLDAQRRAQNCLIAVKKELERWGCTIDPKIQLSSNGIRAAWGIVPLVKVSTT